MAEINKPSDINKIWAAGGEIVTPADTKINTGWVEEIPPHEYENYIQNRQDLAIAHINQHGIAVWDAATEYQAGKSYATGSNGRIYVCVSTNTNQNPVSDISETYWADYNSPRFIVLSSSSTWNVPKIFSLGIKTPKVTATGGGGSGGSGTSGLRGAGGGAGGTAIGTVDLTGVTTVTVTIGAGGARRTTASTNGVAGGQTTFGGYLTANGGQPGTRYATGVAVAGGFGGSASGGQLNIPGGDGSDGIVTQAGVASGGSGDGGSSYHGGGRRGGQEAGSTSPAAPGSGGGGAVTGSSPGANGLIIIEC